MTTNIAPVTAPELDPRIRAGEARKATYIQSVQDAGYLAGPDRIRAIAGLYGALCVDLLPLAVAYTANLRDRQDYLQGRLPVGLTIPAGTSMADEVVVHEAWLAHTADAKAAGHDGRPAMFAEATRAGNTLRARAAFTVASDVSDPGTVQEWLKTQDASTAAEYEELRMLRAAPFDGNRNAWAGLGLAAPKAPREVQQLADMDAAAEATAEGARSSAQATRNAGSWR